MKLIIKNGYNLLDKRGKLVSIILFANITSEKNGYKKMAQNLELMKKYQNILSQIVRKFSYKLHNRP